jgi:hypothetical protein
MLDRRPSQFFGMTIRCVWRITLHSRRLPGRCVTNGDMRWWSVPTSLEHVKVVEERRRSYLPTVRGRAEVRLSRLPV